MPGLAVLTRVPAVPRTMASISGSEPMTATLPVFAGKPAGRLYFRPHGTFGKTQTVQLIGMGFGYGLLRWLAPVDIGGIHVGGDHQQVGLQFLGEKRRAQILVDHGFHTYQLAILIHGRDTATAGSDDDRAFLQQPLERADFKDALGPRTGYYAAEFVAIRCDGPAFSAARRSASSLG